MNLLKFLNPKMKNIQNITILGDGSWGTTLAVYLARKGYSIHLWGAFEENIQHIKKDKENKRFLPGIKIPKLIHPTANLDYALTSSDLIILAIPSKFINTFLNKLTKYDLRHKLLLSVIKGIETKSLLRISQLIEKRLGTRKLAVLSGPTIAWEIARNIPSTAVIASSNITLAKKLQQVFNSQTFRIYTNPDVTGVEIGGSLKNVIAIACGVCDGLGYGSNTKAAIMTRGLVEMARLGVALGAKQKTFSGLAGLGDLITTCVSSKSRNRYVGECLGEGKSIKKIMNSMNMVAEGVETAKAVTRLSKKYKIDMPIASEVYRVIYQNKNPRLAVEHLMSRKAKAE